MNALWKTGNMKYSVFSSVFDGCGVMKYVIALLVTSVGSDGLKLIMLSGA